LVNLVQLGGGEKRGGGKYEDPRRRRKGGKEEWAFFSTLNLTLIKLEGEKRRSGSKFDSLILVGLLVGRGERKKGKFSRPLNLRLRAFLGKRGGN